MQDHKPLRPLAAALAGTFALVLFGACGGLVKISSPTAPSPATEAAPPAQSPPIAQPRYPEPAVRLRAYELFDMGEGGENKYKGKVVHISGLVDVNSTRRPGPGGTSTLVVKGKPGEAPYAIATFGHNSEELLFSGHYQPPSVSVEGTYRGRDEHGTVLLDDARVVSLTNHFPVLDFRPDDPNRPQNPSSENKNTPVVVSAQQLAQDLTDDFNASYKRYYGSPLQIEGVVAEQTKNKDAITLIQMAPAVTDKKTSKPVEFVVFCGLRRHARVGSREAAALAVGKRVTLVGRISAAGNGQVTLTGCVLQKQGSNK